jgi:Transposase
MPMLEGQVDAVIGVDTHRDRHAAALLDPNGGVRATLQVSSDRPGYARLLRLAEVQAPGRRVWALEGTGCYGAGLTRFLVDQGEWVVEIDRPSGPAAETAPRAMGWTRSGPATKPWPATTWPAPASAAIGRPCGCCTPPGPPSWPPGRTPAASSRP